jgi:hypothetical protein
MPDSRAPWLETELARQLCAVSAPDTLWDRIHEQRRPLRVRSEQRLTWLIAAAAVFVVSAGLAWRLGVTRNSSVNREAPNLETLAGMELRQFANGTETTDLRSADPAEIRAWVRSQSHIDIGLPDPPASGNAAVRLIGARLARLGQRSVAVIGYRVGNNFAAMVVTGGRHGTVHEAPNHNEPSHTKPRMTSTANLALYSWSSGSDEYAIAFGGGGEAPPDPKAACLLCHASPALMLFR